MPITVIAVHPNPTISPTLAVGGMTVLSGIVEFRLVFPLKRRLYQWIGVEDFAELLDHGPQEEVPQQTERDHLLAVLFATNWNKSKAAQ